MRSIFKKRKKETSVDTKKHCLKKIEAFKIYAKAICTRNYKARKSSIKTSKNNKFVIVVLQNGKAELINLVTNEIKIFNSIYAASFKNGGDFLLLTRYDKTASLVNLKNNKKVTLENCGKCRVTHDGTLALFYNLKKEAFTLFNLEHNKIVKTFEKQKNPSIQKATLSKDGRFLLATYKQNETELYDLKNNTLVTFNDTTENGSCHLSKSSKFLLIQSTNRKTRLFDLEQSNFGKSNNFSYNILTNQFHDLNENKKISTTCYLSLIKEFKVLNPFYTRLFDHNLLIKNEKKEFVITNLEKDETATFTFEDKFGNETFSTSILLFDIKNCDNNKKYDVFFTKDETLMFDLLNNKTPTPITSFRNTEKTKHFLELFKEATNNKQKCKQSSFYQNFKNFNPKVNARMSKDKKFILFKTCYNSYELIKKGKKESRFTFTFDSDFTKQLNRSHPFEPLDTSYNHVLDYLSLAHSCHYPDINLCEDKLICASNNAENNSSTLQIFNLSEN